VKDSIDEFQHRVWQVVSMIPHGQVATYGQVASLAGAPRQSRMVGKILSRLPPDSRLPWHRVINSQGRISHPNSERQQACLAAEGIVLLNGRVSLSHYRWEPHT
jgi:methylated-DNA-protein-cysteine methyltransferase-like protein